MFNKDKFVFAEETTKFAGFELTPEGYRPPARVLDAIQSFPIPKTITDVRSWFGLVNQVAYAFSQSNTMAPFRELLSSNKRNGKDIYWDDNLGRIFDESKKVIVEKIKDGVCSFEKDRVTCLSTDWSKTGIGFTLTQKYCECPRDQKTNTWSPLCGKGHWRIILAGSRFTKPAESRYAPVEGEALAVVYGLNQCRNFILGSPNLVVAVDHKPLTRILNDRSLECIDNPRLLRLKDKTMYDFQIVHIVGKSNSAPDAASRYPSRVASVLADDVVDEEYAKAYATMQSMNIPGSIN